MQTFSTFPLWSGKVPASKAPLRDNSVSSTSLASRKADRDEQAGLYPKQTRFQLSERSESTKPWLTFQEADENRNDSKPPQKHNPFRMSLRRLFALILGGCILATLWVYVHPWAAVCAFLFILLFDDVN